METELLKNGDAKDQTDKFDDILHIVGSNGPFQKRFIWIYNFTYSLILSMIYYNILMALAIPKHWCYVPGRENTNLTLDKWWELTIPKETDNNGKDIFSQCKIYSSDNTTSTTSCQNGWEYDKTWYESTIVSDNNWVCDKEVYVTQSLIIARFGEFAGTLVAGTLGDILGRRFIIVFTIFSLVLSRIFMLFLSSNYGWFMVLSMLSSITVNTGFLAPLTIGMEITDAKLRETLLSAQYIGWSLGVCLVSFTMWIIRRWDYLFIISTIPAVFIFIFYRYLIESPRWLMSRGKIHKAYVQLKRVADVNNKELPDNFLERLYAMNKKRTKQKNGLLCLVSSWRLFKNTAILTTCWSTVLLVLQILYYNFGNLKGSPFLIFFLLAIAELPVNIFGKIFSKYFGRRLVQFFAFMGAAVSSLILIYYCQHDTPVLILGIVLLVKFFSYLAVYIIDLQAMEIFPTNARQSGTGFCLFCASAICCIGPYITYLGSTYDIRYPYMVVFALVLIGGIGGTFLPETSDTVLPETTEDARVFGKNQSYWNFLNRKPKYETQKNNFRI